MRLFTAVILLAIASETHSLEPVQARATGISVSAAAVAGLSTNSRRLAVAPEHEQASGVTGLETQTRKGLMDTVHAFLQRSTAHSRMRATKQAPSTLLTNSRRPPPSVEPRDIEEMETIWGVPKIVWVILADVLAMAGFLACIPFVMYLAKRRRPEMGNGGGESSGQGGMCACLYPPEPPKMQAYPTGMGGDPGGGYGGGYSGGYSGGGGGAYAGGGYAGGGGGGYAGGYQQGGGGGYAGGYSGGGGYR